MTWIYTCGFGQFIGYSAALMLLLTNKFPEVSMAWGAFLGPFIGAGIRPVGGWLADKCNSGSKVTLYSLILMLASIIVVLLGLQAHSFRNVLRNIPFTYRLPVITIGRHHVVFLRMLQLGH